MVKPNIVVKVRRPTEEFNGSDSDFEVVSDSGNDNDSVIENGYERLNEVLTDVVTLHRPPSENLEGDFVDSDQQTRKKMDSDSNEQQKIVVHLTPKQITGDESRLERKECRDKKSLSLVMISKEMTLMDVAVPVESTENFISRSVSSNFVDRLNTALSRRNGVDEETLKESLSNTRLSEVIKNAPIPAARKLSDSAVISYSKNLSIPQETIRKNSMPAALPTTMTLQETSKIVKNDGQTDSSKDLKTETSSRWSFYKEVNIHSTVDQIRDE